MRIRAGRVIGEETTEQERYYISSVHTRKATELGRAVRAHWGIENGLHWCLDVCFGDDSSRVRVRNAAQNLTRLKRITLNLLKLAPMTKSKSIKSKRFVADSIITTYSSPLRRRPPSRYAPLMPNDFAIALENRATRGPGHPVAPIVPSTREGARMRDSRLEKLADVIVRYSTRVKPGDLVSIVSEPDALPLIEAVYERVLKAGGHPYWWPRSESLDHLRLSQGARSSSSS